MFRTDNKGRPALALVYCMALVITGCRKAGTEDSGAKNPLPKAPVPVQAVQAKLTTLKPSVDLVGVLVALPENTTTVSPQVGGWIQKVSVVEGAAVRAGDELALLDARFVEADVAKAVASVAEKEATLARLKRGYLPQEIEVVRFEVRKCQAQVASLQAESAALKPLRKNNEVPELQVQKVESSLRAAEAGQAAAEAKLKQLLIGTPREEITEAEARLDMAKAERATAKLNLQFCRITSPITGTVTQLAARQGMFVERSAPLLTIADLSKLFLQVRIPSIHMAKVQAEARVEVRVGSQPDEVLSGRVARISGQADSTTGDVDAFVEVSNGKASLRPGLTCRGRLWLPEMPGVLVVPVAAVADHAGTPVVTVARDGKAQEIEVVVGVRTSDQVHISKGLRPDDWVITRGGYGLPENCPVQIVSDPAAVKPATSAH